MSPKNDAPDEPTGPVQRYRFRVRTASGQELVSHIASVRLPPPAPLKETAGPGKSYLVSAIFVLIEGTKQGKFKGEARDPHPHQLAALEFEYGVKSPRDLATGQASGKRQHNPIVITKEWGPATPQLFQACVTNEVLKSVVIDCYGSDGTQENELVHTVKLTNASVARVHQQADAQRGSVEQVSFTFQKIEISSAISRLTATDDWTTHA